MKLWILYPVCAAVGSGFMLMVVQSAKFLPDWAYYGLWLLVVPGAVGFALEIYRTRKSSK